MFRRTALGANYRLLGIGISALIVAAIGFHIGGSGLIGLGKLLIFGSVAVIFYVVFKGLKELSRQKKNDI